MPGCRKQPWHSYVGNIHGTFRLQLLRLSVMIIRGKNIDNLLKKKDV